jgi:hypothetical protein
MALTREGLLARADAAEASAARAADPVISRAYLELAAAFREMANEDSIAAMSDEEVEALVRRMVDSSASKL